MSVAKCKMLDHPSSLSQQATKERLHFGRARCMSLYGIVRVWINPALGKRPPFGSSHASIANRRKEKAIGSADGVLAAKHTFSILLLNPCQTGS